MRLEYLDDMDAVLSSDEVEVLNSGSPEDTWIDVPAITLGPAPAGGSKCTDFYRERQRPASEPTVSGVRRGLAGTDVPEEAGHQCEPLAGHGSE